MQTFIAWFFLRGNCAKPHWKAQSFLARVNNHPLPYSPGRDKAASEFQLCPLGSFEQLQNAALNRSYFSVKKITVLLCLSLK